ncbi:hypothetical protein QBC37DRAFT_379228 [Rhypophila decipiens]|uniref:Secreted protein n=1 Tax=Rhypophila decipiens TaxID=261697 RepID=A0AAN7B370_9PEZI|nr:hypothetical protein QBC37DRAFT_379228 [Rhypophila decipiens]
MQPPRGPTALSLLLLATPALSLCKPAVGIEVYTDHWAHTFPCGRFDCNTPETTIKIVHNDGSTTEDTFPGAIGFGYSDNPKVRVHEWDFYGKFRDDPGLGFHVYAARCGSLPSNQGFGCYGQALRIERGHLPKATWDKFKCGNV